MRPEYSGSPKKLVREELFVLGAAAIFSAAIYLFASAVAYRPGFPLDDSWIHQTYARNLALHGQWAFRLGFPSAGSTAPLWSGLLAIGYWLGLGPYAWTYALGVACLFGLSVVSEAAARQLLKAYCPRLPWVGLLMAAEWHLVWAAMSGMETLLHALLITSVLIGAMTGSRRFLTMGVLTGLSVWVRPDGLTLLGPAVLSILVINKDQRSRLRGLEYYLLGFGALFFAYLLFNLWIGGKPMPNTFYAKQAEYAAWQASPLLSKLAQLALQMLAGPVIILLPGAVGWLALRAREGDWRTLGTAAWFAGYTGLYVARLPLYQHGRYIMPAMPIFLLWGMLGLLYFLSSERLKRYQWFVSTLWRTSLVMVLLLFVVLGARSYGDDVGLIETEMVNTAQWVHSHLPPDTIIAAHDIGALGFFDDHPLLDLAGLISPEAVPFMRDEGQLEIYLNQRKAEYLIAFPEFYPELVEGKKQMFNTKAEFSPRFGHDNMVVYRWK
jgi:hypothetical protein